MSKALAAALATLTLVAALLGGALWVTVAKNADLSAQVNSLTEAQERAVARAKADRATLVARQAKIASQGRKLAQAQQALSEALQHEKAWSDTDVPTAVQNALSGRSGGPDSAPVGVLDGSDRP
jgi:uncharacterized protein HemX